MPYGEPSSPLTSSRESCLPRYVVLPVTPSCAYSDLIVDSFFYGNFYHIWSQTNICPETARNYPCLLTADQGEQRLKVQD